MQIIANTSPVERVGLSKEVTDPQLARSAHAFEASLMKELLAPLQQGAAPENETEEGSGGALAGFAVESLAGVISERGGFGIAERVLHSLAASHAHTSQDNRAGNAATQAALHPRA